MSDAPATPPKLPAWALLTGATLLAVGTRVLIAVAERSAGFGQTKELTATSIAAAALAAAVGTYVGRRWINRPSGFLLGVALAGIAMLLLAGTSNIGVGLGVGLVMSGIVLWLRNPWRMAAAAVVSLAAGAVTYFAVPVENAIIWGALAGVLAFLVYGYRIPRREGRGLKTWIAFAGRTAAIALAAGLTLWWGRLAPVRALIAKVQRAGGYVGFQPLHKGPLRPLRRQLESSGLLPVLSIGVSMSDQDNSLLSGLRWIPSLGDLEVADAALDRQTLSVLARLPALKSLRLTRCQVERQAWADLAQSRSLSRLDLSGTTLGNNGITQLANIPILTTLCLENSGVTATGLAEFAAYPRLSTLHLSGPEISVEFLRALDVLPSVMDFSIARSERDAPAPRPTPASSPFRELGSFPELAAVRSVPNLKKLSVVVPLDEDLRRALIREAPNVLWLVMSRAGSFHPDPKNLEGPSVQADLSYSDTLTELLHLLPPRPELRCVDVSGCQLQSGDLATVAALPNLETLVLDRASIPDDSLDEMTAAPQLATVSLRMVNVPVISQTLWAAKFPRMPALRNLDLAYNGIADADLTALVPFPNLWSLNLKGNPLTDAGLAHLTGMTSLEALDLRETQVTAVGVQALQTKLPSLEIRWNGP